MITLHDPLQQRTLTFFLGGTYSATGEQAWRLYRPENLPILTRAIWCGDPTMTQDFRIVGWRGGLPVKWLWFTTDDPRRDAVQGLLTACDSAVQLGIRRIALVGFSHAGTICIRALDTMLQAHAWQGCEFRLVTLATPPLRDTLAAANRVADHGILPGRATWFGVVDRRDSVVTGFAGIEALRADGSPAFGVESGYRLLATEREGLAAHDGLPGSVEAREAVRDFFLTRRLP